MKDRTWIIAFAATVFAMMTMQMSSLGFSPLLPAIQKDFDVSYSKIGFFTGVYGLVALALSIPGGVLAKRFGEHKMLTAGLVGIAFGMFCLSQAPDYNLGLASRILWLCGYRISFVCVMAAVALSAPPAFKGTAMGILGAASAMASVVGAPFGTQVADAAGGWRAGIMAFAGMALLGAVVFGSFYRRNANAAGGGGSHGHGGGRPDANAFRNPRVWALVLLGMANMGGFSATFFVPSAVKTIFNLDPREAATIISTAYFAAIFVNLGCGYLADRFNRWTVISVVILLLIPASFAMMTTNLLLFRIATAAIVSLGLAVANQVYALANEVAAGQDIGPVMGIASLGGGVFGYMGPQMLGYLRDTTGGFTAGWYFVAAGAALSFVVVLLLRRAVERRRAVAV